METTETMEKPATEKLVVKFLDPEEKSAQQREQELIRETQPPVPPIVETEEVPEIEFKDEEVFGYLAKKLNKTITSYDDLFVEKVVEKEAELPENVNAFYKYTKETGRGFEDYIKLQRDIDKEDPDNLLLDYYLTKEEGVDKEYVEGVVMDEFRHVEIDEDLDTEDEIKSKTEVNRKKDLSKKKAIKEAKKFFETQKENYKVPLESSMASLSDEDKIDFAEYKQYKSTASQDHELAQQKGKVFEQKTNDVLNDGFKGFEFNVGDKSIVFKPADVLEIKNSNSSPMNLIGKFLDKDGFISDPVGYHKALTVATFSDRFAKHFYEQGKADATNEVLKEIKNTDMGERTTPKGVGKEGLQVKFLNEDVKFGIKGQ